ncbi:MAG: PhoU domain-containing protein [Candidatus Geothermarchaeales archaeon]
METRKVQKLGHSSVVVSLPKKWVNQVGLRPGDTVSIDTENDFLKITPHLGAAADAEKAVRYVVNTDLISEAGLIERVLTGNFILGHDAVELVSKKGRIRSEQLDEVRKVANRLNGVGIVEQSLEFVTVQSFIDPTKFPVKGLIERLYVILSSMLDAAILGALEGDYDVIKEVSHMEDEVDRLYWLIVRQLLLSQRNREIAKAVGIESQLHIVGNRTIAKSLEEMGDRAEEIAGELLRWDKKDLLQNRDVLTDLKAMTDRVKKILDDSMRALFTLDLKLANNVIQEVGEIRFEVKSLDREIFKRISEALPASILKTVLSNLVQFAEHLDTIAEITINRALEAPSEICEWKEQGIGAAEQRVNQR